MIEQNRIDEFEVESCLPYSNMVPITDLHVYVTAESFKNEYGIVLAMWYQVIDHSLSMSCRSPAWIVPSLVEDFVLICLVPVRRSRHPQRSPIFSVSPYK